MLWGLEMKNWESRWEMVALTRSNLPSSAAVAAVTGRGTWWGQEKDKSPVGGQVTWTSAEEGQLGEVR